MKRKTFKCFVKLNQKSNKLSYFHFLVVYINALFMILVCEEKAATSIKVLLMTNDDDDEKEEKKVEKHCYSLSA
jgi:hypothetical protein